MNPSLELQQKLDRVGRRFRVVRLWHGLALAWALLAAIGVALLLAPSLLAPRAAAIGLCALAIAVALLGWLSTRRIARDPRWVAQRIEAANPDLAALLLTAIDQAPTPGSRLGFLQEAVVDSAVQHARSHRWEEAMPTQSLTRARRGHTAMLASLACVIALLANQASRKPAPSEDSTVAVALVTNEGTPIEVQPGHTSLERGSPLLFTARFPGRVPVEALIVFEAASPIAARPMTRNLDDPTFAGHLAAVDTDLSYRVEFPGGTSENFRVRVFEHPELKRLNARLQYPSFARLEPKTLEDVRHVTVVEGSEVTLLAEFTKPIANAVLLDERNAATPFTLDVSKSQARLTLTPAKSQRYRLQLTDADGRANKQPASVAIHVTKNLPPTVAVKSPSRDARVSPIEELSLLAEMKDDFALVRYGLQVTLPDQSAKEVVLGESDATAAVKKVQPTHLIDFESLKAQPDQVVSYHFWAEDLGPDGKPRRTSGDLFFAEVRHFEEIFRQGEPQQESQAKEQKPQGNAAQAEQLAEMQKQIIAGIWKLIRRETGAMPSAVFAEDLDVLQKSQQAVLEQAAGLLEKLKAAESIEFLNKAMTFMTESEKHLGNSVEMKSASPLPRGLGSAQAAYQALLKLRAREFEVQKSNSRSRSQSARSNPQSRPSQEQLRQLDLAEEENRYETQQQAKLQQENQAQRDREQKELQELANKLRDLARRQGDLNDRVKELQAALEQAKDEARKAELQRQLRRLQEQQQQVLRDTDELQEKMENQENRERMAETKQQVEQSRESVRQASEALEKGQLQKAINEGTRAGRLMEDLRDKLRKEAAGRFGEEIRDLRRQARDLDDKQQKLTQKLDEMTKDNRPALREPAGKEGVQKSLDEQKKEFDKITERMEKTVRDAEETEPALAQALFNTAQKAAEQKTGEALDAAKQLAQAGAAPEAADAAKQAARGTEQLRKGIEKAAENVLGGQTEALKRAQRELDDLAKQLDKEIASAQGSGDRRQESGKKKESGVASQESGKKKESGVGSQESGKKDLASGGRESPEAKEKAKGATQGKAGSNGGKGGEGEGEAPAIDELPEKPDLRKLGGQRKPSDTPRGGEQTATGAGPHSGPIREQGFREWFDRMRAAEDLIEDPKLRADAARIREKVRSEREEFKRHSKEPNWGLLKDQASKPLAELRERIAAEIRRRESPEALVPIDRDPVPAEFIEGVRKYYERLGSER